MKQNNYNYICKHQFMYVQGFKSQSFQSQNQNYRQSGGDWAMYNMPPSSLYPTQQPGHPSQGHASPPSSGPRSYITPESLHYPASHKKAVVHTHLELEDLLNSQCSMETLDRRIPPSVRPSNQETFSLADSGMARLQQLYSKNNANSNRLGVSDNKSDFMVSSKHHRMANSRRSCDISQIDYEHQVGRRRI